MVVVFAVGGWRVFLFCLFVVCFGWGGRVFAFFFPISIFVILLFHIKAGEHCARHRKDDGNRDR